MAQFIDGGGFGWLAGWACAGTDEKENPVPNYTDCVQDDRRGSTNLAGARGKR